MVPALRSLLEFAHPALAITGLAFWLGFTFVHTRALGWIAFGLVTATICLGLTWFAANTRAARSTVWRTLQRNCIARVRGKYSGCSRKLTSCTVAITGAGQANGAVYWTCSKLGRSAATRRGRS